METRVNPFVQFASLKSPVRKQQPVTFAGKPENEPGSLSRLMGGQERLPMPSTAQYLSFMGNVRFGAKTELPPAPRDNSVVEDFHGTTVADPYRPLEDLDAPETVSWWKAQNKRTEAYLAGAEEEREAATKWHEEIRDYTRESLPSQRGKNWFFSRQEGLDPQPTYYVRVGRKNAKAQVLFDPNKMSDDGTVALSTQAVSPDGKLVAYTTSEAGSDWQTMHVRDVATGKDLPDELTKIRFTNATWDPDGKGFFYARPEGENENGKYFAVYHHTLGAKQEDDPKVYERPDVQNSFVGAYRLEKDDEMLFMAVGSGTTPEDGTYFRRPGETEFTEILPPGVAKMEPFYRKGDTVYATTDLDAPTGRIVAIDLKNPAKENWTTVVPESTTPGSKLEYAFVSGGNKLFLGWKEGGADKVEVRSLDGKFLHNVPIPEGSTVGFGQVREKDKSFNIVVGGYLSPGTTYKYDVATNKLTFVKKSNIARDLTNTAKVERLYATSKDGTQVPMWVISPKNLKKDKTAAVQLYGYGGFDVSLEPGFSMDIMHWVEQGGVYVVANLRGGGEFGREWNEGGKLKNKQNVFDDFAACAEKLSKDGYTCPERTLIYGGSNGGLLTAATSQQYPDHFGAVVSAVPVTDMLRFQTDNYGAAWMSDYGNPAVKEDFEVSYAYSPLHNVADAKGTTYPPTLIMTGDHDDRVAPWHAFKWAATRQEKGHQKNTYLRVEERAGHGAGKPTKKIIENSADRYAFAVQTLGPLDQEEYKARQSVELDD